jgi:hypothetical protein
MNLFFESYEFVKSVLLGLILLLLVYIALVIRRMQTNLIHLWGFLTPSSNDNKVQTVATNTYEQHRDQVYNRVLEHIISRAAFHQQRLSSKQSVPIDPERSSSSFLPMDNNTDVPEP